MSEPLFHVADAGEWASAVAVGRYERSTRGLGLADVGFVHLSTAAQWPGVLDRFYSDHEGPLVLLTIDPDAVRRRAPLGGSRTPAPTSCSPTSTVRSRSVR